MKKILTLFACAFYLFGCQPSAKDPNEIIIGTNAQYYPFEFKQEGELQGFDIELAYLLGKALDKKVTILDMDFDALIISLKQKKVDVIMAGISITPEREKAITMIPYQGVGASELYLVYSSTTPLNKDLEDATIKVACEASTFQAKFVKNNYPDAQLKTLNNYSDMLLELRAGKIDTILMEPHVYKGIKAKDATLTYKSVAVPEGQRGKGNGIGLVKDNDALALELQKALLQLAQSGQLQVLETKWFGEQHDA